MLTETQMEELLTKMSVPLASDAIISKDQFPKKPQTNKAYIINLEDQYDEKGELNVGSHWTAFYIREYPNGKIEPISFCPFGMPPPEIIKKNVMKHHNKKTPFTQKNIQSLMSNACGWFCCAFLHYITAYPHRTGDLYTDVEQFLSFFDNLDTSIEFKKNEYILKHFFQSSNPALRKVIEVISPTNNIVNDNNGGIDAFQPL